MRAILVQKFNLVGTPQLCSRATEEQHVWNCLDIGDDFAGLKTVSPLVSLGLFFFCLLVCVKDAWVVLNMFKFPPLFSNRHSLQRQLTYALLFNWGPACQPFSPSLFELTSRVISNASFFGNVCKSQPFGNLYVTS